ncbi:MAG: dTMP kinase [Gammaproteobacteria bacterium]|nr:dTMP kinase [Gammaproteobacteria bacterium]
MNPSAHFITFEGIEGVGKTTAVSHVVARLRAQGHPVVATREPGGTPLGERIRDLLLDPGTTDMVPVTELLLMFAARAQHVGEVIDPALARGDWVVCDRFTDATYAYQGGGRGLDSTLIAQAEAMVHPTLQPHLTLLLDAPVTLALGRARARGAADRFERERVEFFERVRVQYLERARRFPRRFAVIDATRPLAEVQSSIDAALEARFA